LRERTNARSCAPTEDHPTCILGLLRAASSVATRQHSVSRTALKSTGARR
jgi:hypothetical protein